MNKNTYLLKKNKNIKYSLPDIFIKFEKLEINNISSLEEYTKLVILKNKIDNLEDTQLWDHAKKLSNLYELIYLPNKKYKYHSISNYEPLSRAYFKLFEILVDFNLIDSTHQLKIASIAEGPGGFIEGCINYRKRITKKKDLINAITLYSNNKDIPGWNKSKNFLKKNQNVNISYGKDETGDLYKIENILEYSKLFNNDADFITADGGFDFSYNFNRQEQLSYRIIFCEIVTALSVQKKGGNFVIKIFDIYTEITKSLIYLLFVCYDKVYITKPNTSRAANSEKYLICKNFCGINPNYLKKLYIVIDSLRFISENDFYLNQIFKFNFDDEFINNLNSINLNFYENQVKNIKETLKIIEEKKDLNVEFNSKIKKQTMVAFNWCKYYKVSVNYSSKYLVKYLN